MLPVFLGVVLFSLAATSVFADPLVAGGVVAIGDHYMVTTISGTASAWINGQSKWPSQSTTQSASNFRRSTQHRLQSTVRDIPDQKQAVYD
jgi:hypothetical protein